MVKIVLVIKMYYENKKENFIKYIIFFMLIIIIFLLWIMVMKMDYPNQNIYGNYNSEKLAYENIINQTIEDDILDKGKDKEKVENMIEKCTRSIVGISKIKQNDSVHFSIIFSTFSRPKISTTKRN